MAISLTAHELAGNYMAIRDLRQAVPFHRRERTRRCADLRSSAPRALNPCEHLIEFLGSEKALGHAAALTIGGCAGLCVGHLVSRIFFLRFVSRMTISRICLRPVRQLARIHARTKLAHCMFVHTAFSGGLDHSPTIEGIAEWGDLR